MGTSVSKDLTISEQELLLKLARSLGLQRE